MNEDDIDDNDECNEYEMISGMWYAIGNLPCSHYDFLGEELYDMVNEYLHGGDVDYEEDDDEDDEEDIPF